MTAETDPTMAAIAVVQSLISSTVDVGIATVLAGSDDQPRAAALYELRSLHLAGQLLPSQIVALLVAAGWSPPAPEEAPAPPSREGPGYDWYVISTLGQTIGQNLSRDEAVSLSNRYDRANYYSGSSIRRASR